jgi:hypothetical protein
VKSGENNVTCHGLQTMVLPRACGARPRWNDTSGLAEASELGALGALGVGRWGGPDWDGGTRDHHVGRATPTWALAHCNSSSQLSNFTISSQLLLRRQRPCHHNAF